MNEKKKLTGSTKWLMLGSAFFLDLMGLSLAIIPIIGQMAGEFIAVFGNLIFLLWFFIKKIPIRSTKRVANILGNAVGEALTTGLWPGFTAMVLLTIAMDKGEKGGDEKGK